MRTSSNSTPWATSQLRGEPPQPGALVAGHGLQRGTKLVPERVFTSQTTITWRSAATMSISPAAAPPVAVEYP